MTSKTLAPQVRGARGLVAILPSGRSVWLKVDPAVVPLRDLEHAAASIDRAHVCNARTLSTHATAVQRLRRQLQRDARALNRVRLREQLGLLNQTARGDEKLERRMDHSLMPVLRHASERRAQQRILARSAGRRDAWNQLLLVSGMLLMSAYGRRGSPLASDNLVIGLALGVWLLGEEVSDFLMGKRSVGDASVRRASLWSYAAPFANLLAGWWLLGTRQHYRFITGTADLPVGRPRKDRMFAVVTELSSPLPRGGAAIKVEQTDTYWTKIDLSSLVAPDHLADFQAFDDVPALATMQALEVSAAVRMQGLILELLLAEVRQGVLLISVRFSAKVLRADLALSGPVPLLQRLCVTWAVDTQKPSD